MYCNSELALYYLHVSYLFQQVKSAVLHMHPDNQIHSHIACSQGSDMRQHNRWWPTEDTSLCRIELGVAELVAIIPCLTAELIPG